MMALLRRLGLAPPRRQPPLPPPDGIGDRLRAAVTADVKAKAANVETHEARVNAMIDDFFRKYGARDAGIR